MYLEILNEFVCFFFAPDIHSTYTEQDAPHGWQYHCNLTTEVSLAASLQWNDWGETDMHYLYNVLTEVRVAVKDDCLPRLRAMV